MAAFVNYKHGITALNVTPTGDAGLAINNNFITIGDLFDTVMTRASSPTAGHLASLDGSGNVLDSGIASSAITTNATNITSLGTTKADKVVVATNNHVATLDGTGNLKDSGIASSSLSLLTSGLVPTTNLGSGTASSTTFLRGDQCWQVFPTPTTISGSITESQVTNLTSDLASKVSAATCEIIHPNGTRTAYNAASNTDAAQGTAIAAAVSAAVSGDWIMVYRSAIITTNLAKNGVNWLFAPGVTIKNNSNSAGFIFDDGGSAMTYIVGGSGNFYREISSGDSSMVGSVGAAFGGGSLTTGGDTGVYCQSNASTNVVFNFNEAGMEWTGAAVNGSPYQSILQSRAGQVIFRGKRVYNMNNTFSVSTVGVWWILGKCIAEIELFDCISYTFYAACSNSTTGDFYITAQEIGQGVGASANTDPTAAVWIKAGTIRQNTSPTTYNDGGKLYVDAQKIFGGFVLTNASASSQTFVNTSKLGGDSAGSDYIYADSSGNGSNTVMGWFNILKFDPTSANRLLFATTARTTINLSGFDLSVLSGSDGIASTSSATINLLTGNLITSSGQKDLNAQGSSVINVGYGFKADPSKSTVTGSAVINWPTSATRVTSTFNRTSTTALASITGLTATLGAGKTYSFVARIQYTADATGGLKIAIGGSCTATSIVYSATAGATAITNAQQTALAGAASFTGSTAGVVVVEGTITVNAAGTLTVQLAQSASSATSTSALAGSTFDVKQVP